MSCPEDEQHEKYFKKYPKGNHTVPSPETDRRLKVLEKFVSDFNDFKVELLLKVQEISISSKGAHDESKETNGKLARAEKRIQTLEKDSELNKKFQETLVKLVGELQQAKTDQKSKADEKREKRVERVWSILTPIVVTAVIGILGGAFSLIVLGLITKIKTI